MQNTKKQVIAVSIMVVSRLCLLLIGQSDGHTPQRVQNLLCVLVTHRVFRGTIQQLMGNFFCLVHDRRKGHIIVVANVVKQPFQLHHQAGCIHFAAGRLLQLPGHTLYLGLRSMVPCPSITLRTASSNFAKKSLIFSITDFFSFWVRSASFLP